VAPNQPEAMTPMRADVTGLGAWEPRRCRRIGIAKIRRKRRSQRQQGRHPGGCRLKLKLPYPSGWSHPGDLNLSGGALTPGGDRRPALSLFLIIIPHPLIRGRGIWN
jgi:hypothetical protein